MNTLDGARAVRLADAQFHAPRAEIDGSGRAAGGHPREILATHRPNADHTSCTACDFTYTPALPLCPSVAEALRELSIGDTRPHTKTSPLARHSTAKLRAMANTHTGGGRCARCGFVYSAQMRRCPTLRNIATELESRGSAPMTQPRTDQGLCAGKGTGWTVNGNQSAPWKRAMAACSVCPLLAQCTADLENRLAAGETVREQIQAARLFTVDGREVLPEKVEEFAVARGRTKRSKKPSSTRRTCAKPKAAILTAAPSPVPAPARPAVQLALFEAA
ncbi:MAG: hypothetical protein ACI9JD_000065 [Rhodococcus sp. (in: high G+C Gram-positive bacteria)]|jgi:hypothetical protein